MTHQDLTSTSVVVAQDSTAYLSDYCLHSLELLASKPSAMRRFLRGLSLIDLLILRPALLFATACVHSLGLLASNPSQALAAGAVAPELAWEAVAPELAWVHESTARTDMYAMGVLLLELVTGRRPLDPSLPPTEQSLVRWVSDLKSLVRWVSDLKSLGVLGEAEADGPGQGEAKVDPKLQGSFALPALVEMVKLAARRLLPDPEERALLGSCVFPLPSLLFPSCLPWWRWSSSPRAACCPIPRRGPSLAHASFLFPPSSSLPACPGGDGQARRAPPAAQPRGEGLPFPMRPPTTGQAKPKLMDRAKVEAMVDPKLQGSFALPALVEMVKLAGRCLLPDPEVRPTAAAVVEILDALVVPGAGEEFGNGGGGSGVSRETDGKKQARCAVRTASSSNDIRAPENFVPPEPKPFSVASGQLGAVIGASLPILFRLGTGVFSEGYKAKVESSSAVKDEDYALGPVMGYKLVETTTGELKPVTQPIEIYEFEG
ncbi:unnamed protein product [Closterium sp. NIES-64]|nr:unnamed protein product [Closterium sp. NIES-64]